MANIDALKIEIFNFLTQTKGSTIDRCFAVYSRIIKGETLDEQSELFKYSCETFGTKRSTNEVKIDTVVSKQEREKFVDELGKYVNGLLDTFLRRNTKEADFYRGLWEAIISDKIVLKDQSEKAFAVYYILIDSRIPYFRLGESIQMSTEKLNEHLSNLLIYRQKIRFILSIPIDSKTERAGYLLDVLDEFEKSPDERAALMVYLMESLKKKRNHMGGFLDDDDDDDGFPSHLVTMFMERLEEIIGS